jgi:hypothetical protein
MSDLKNKIKTLKLKRAMLLNDIESLSTVDDSMYLQLGKVVSEVSKKEKELNRQTENIIN